MLTWHLDSHAFVRLTDLCFGDAGVNAFSVGESLIFRSEELSTLIDAGCIGFSKRDGLRTRMIISFSTDAQYAMRTSD